MIVIAILNYMNNKYRLGKYNCRVIFYGTSS